MGMQKVPIAEASDQDLRLFATLVQGLQISAKANRDTIIARLSAVWDADYIVLNFDAAEQAQMIKGTAPAKPGAAPEEEAPVKKWTKEEIEKHAGAGLQEAPSSIDPRVTLFLSETAGAKGKEPAFISVNGRGILIPRKREVTIAYRYYLILVNTITDEVEQDFENEQLVTNEVSRFPIRLVKGPSEEEIREWDRAQALACNQAA